ncbi:hypothetical protein ACR6C2_07785 [Streptomyces sp. INA 01156]
MRRASTSPTPAAEEEAARNKRSTDDEDAGQNDGQEPDAPRPDLPVDETQDEPDTLPASARPAPVTACSPPPTA